MASGYVTSDGKDLDSRYLGINAKAASAKVADSATNVTNKGAAKRGSPIFFSASLTAPYTVAANGIVSTGGAVTCMVNTTDTSKDSVSAYVNKGDKVYFSYGEKTAGALYPVVIG